MFNTQLIEITEAVLAKQDQCDVAVIAIDQWFSNCASRCPGASFQFSKGVVEYFGFVSLNLGFIASKEL